MDSSIFIVEIKASCNDPQRIKRILEKRDASFKGIDHQIDYYFKVPEGRLKIRKGSVENSLIYYNRKEAKGLKESSVELVKLHSDQVEDMLRLQKAQHPLLTKVDKERAIYFIDNIKFHIDKVKGLGQFIEIEAINFNDESHDVLEKQCKSYCGIFNIQDSDYIDCSYSDLMLRSNQ